VTLATQDVAQAQPKPRSRFDVEQTITGYALILPTVIFFLVFIVFPIAYSIWLSFLNWDGMSPDPRYIGLRNYERLFSNDRFWNSMRVTAVYVIGLVPLRMAIALFLALLLNQKIRGLAFYRTLYFMPVVTSMVAVSMVFLWIFDPTWGIANYILNMFGLPSSQWLADPNTAMPSLILLSIWKSVGYEMVIYLAGLQGIPDVYYEAAKIDGAGRWAQLRHITWPLLAPTTFFILVTAIIGATQVFDSVFVMTQGGPLESTSVIVYFLYQEAFRFFHMGYAAAVAWVLFLVILALTLIQWKFLRRDVTIG
jgi:multiple sugar transport system permease protein